MLLCDTVARGLIRRLCEPDNAKEVVQEDKGKGRAEKGTEKAATVFLDPAAQQDVHKALEVCQCCVAVGTAPVHDY